MARGYLSYVWSKPRTLKNVVSWFLIISGILIATSFNNFIPLGANIITWKFSGILNILALPIGLMVFFIGLDKKNNNI